MSYQINISEPAKNDLRDIHAYITYSLRAALTASRQVQRIMKSINELDDMPERFRAYEKEPWSSRGLRVMRVDHYLVFYLLDRNARTVEVVRVMHGGRNVEAQLSRFTG